MRYLILSLLLFSCSSHADTSKPSAAAEQLIQQLSLQTDDKPSRAHPRWSKPKQIVVVIPAQFKPISSALVSSIKKVAGDIPIQTYTPEAGKNAPDFLKQAEVVFAHCNKELLAQLPQLIWMQHFSSGSEACTATAGISNLNFTLTNIRRIAAPAIAEHAIALTMALARQLPVYQQQQSRSQWQRQLQGRGNNELSGKTMLVLGLGGIGTEVAKRAHSLGMRVIATRNSSRNGPDFVDYVGLSNEMNTLAQQADIVINALPLTHSTADIINQAFFSSLKQGSYYISVGRGKTTDLNALMDALNSGKLAGAGLDVTNPEPLPKEHPLWSMDNVIITPHIAGYSMAAIQRSFILYQENLRRYLEGDKLLNVVDLQKGY